MSNLTPRTRALVEGMAGPSSKRGKDGVAEGMGFRNIAQLIVRSGLLVDWRGTGLELEVAFEMALEEVIDTCHKYYLLEKAARNVFSESFQLLINSQPALKTLLFGSLGLEVVAKGIMRATREIL